MGVIAVTMAMVTARVDAERKREAEMVLKRHGLTYSDVIRDLTNYLADTGELPEFERITLDLVRDGRWNASWRSSRCSLMPSCPQ